MRAGLLVAVLAAFFAGGCVNGPDLRARNLVVDWNTKVATAEVANIGNEDAGEFMVYFNGEENPESQQDRPQVRFRVTAMAAGESQAFTADFAPLASVHNANLSRIFMIVVLVDPKHTVEEADEDNNLGEALIPNPDQSRPDLIVVDIFQDGPDYIVSRYANVGGPGTGAPGEDFFFSASALGNTFGTPSVNTNRYPVPTPMEILETGGLTMGLIGLSPGMTADVTSRIDYEERVEESREDNNTLTKRIRIE